MTKEYAQGVLDGSDYEHRRIVEIVEDLDLTEMQKDLIIHSIARDNDNEN